MVVRFPTALISTGEYWCEQLLAPDTIEQVLDHRGELSAFGPVWCWVLKRGSGSLQSRHLTAWIRRQSGKAIGVLVARQRPVDWAGPGRYIFGMLPTGGG